MSDKDLDKLFKSKLEDFGESPGESAWAKISAGLEDEKPFAWWRIAAAILLLCVSGVVVFQVLTPGDTTAPIAEVKSASESPLEKPVDESPSQEILHESAEQSGETSNTQQGSAPIPSAALPEKTETLAVVSEDDPLKGRTEATANTSEPRRDEQSVIALTETAQETPVDTWQERTISTPAPENMNESAPTVTGTTRSFNIEDFDKAAQAEIASLDDGNRKDRRGIRKVLSVLQQVKEPENGIGELREMKNGLLAFGKSKKETDKQ